MPTNTSIPSPVCLHIPELSRSRPAEILWEDNCGYELDWSVLRESSEPVTAWLTLETAETAWQSLADQEVTWQSLQWPLDIDPDWQPLYRGPGNPAALSAPDCGPGHILHETEIPEDALSIRFRVRSRCGDQYSPYTTSERLPVELVSGPEITGRAELSLTAGQEYQVQVNLREVPDFKDGVITLAYPAALLALSDAFLDTPDFKTDLGEHTYSSGVGEVAREPGLLRFRCVREIPENTDLTTLAVCFRFSALAGGSAIVTLS